MSAKSIQILTLDNATEPAAGDTAFLGGLKATWTEEAVILTETEHGSGVRFGKQSPESMITIVAGAIGALSSFLVQVPRGSVGFPDSDPVQPQKK